MEKLFICETPIQIIIAMCLKEQILNLNDKTSIILTNTFNGYENIAERIIQLGVFNSVYTAKINYNSNLNKILKFRYIFCIRSFLEKIMDKNEKIYDEIYFWNYDSFTGSLLAYLTKVNKNTKTFIFEEGYISYLPYEEVNKYTLLMKFIILKNKIFHIKLSRDNRDGMYLFEPKLLIDKPQFPVFKIDKTILETKEFKDNIKIIFNVENELPKYDRKYIILEEFHKEYNDEEIFDKIINIVGKENVIIKLHPRRPEDRFAKKGVKTLGSNGVPWEALLVAGDFSDKVIISIGSSSVTTQRILFGNEKMNAYLLFKCIGADLKQFDNKYSGFWDKLKSNNSQCGIHIPDTLDEFYAMLKKETEKDKK